MFKDVNYPLLSNEAIYEQNCPGPCLSQISNHHKVGQGVPLMPYRWAGTLGPEQYCSCPSLLPAITTSAVTESKVTA